jgi:hypothetical protein
MVDLSLASSYVPAFVCIVKCLVVSSLAYLLLPLGGISALGVFVLMDRVFLNSEFIMDVNAVVFATLWSQLANHERLLHGYRFQGSVVLSAAWCAVALVQLLRPSTLRGKSELYVYAVLAICVAATHVPREPFAYVAARTFAFDLAVLLQIYWHIAVGQDEPLVLTVFRYAFVLVAAPPLALLGSLCCCVVVALRWRPPAAQAVARDDQDVEAAASVLREALASRKEKSGN